LISLWILPHWDWSIFNWLYSCMVSWTWSHSRSAFNALFHLPHCTLWWWVIPILSLRRSLLRVSLCLKWFQHLLLLFDNVLYAKIRRLSTLTLRWFLILIAVITLSFSSSISYLDLAFLNDLRCELIIIIIPYAWIGVIRH
jgi:hypothetical protein